MSVLAFSEGLSYYFKEWCVVEIGCEKHIVGWDTENKTIKLSDPIDQFDNEKNPTEALTSHGDRIVLVGNCRLTIDSHFLVMEWIKQCNIESTPRFLQKF